MTGFAVSQDALQQAVLDIRIAAGRLRDDRDHVDSHVRRLLGAAWSGATADSFAESWAAWRAGAQDVLDGLVAAGALLEATRCDYDTTDDGVGGLASRLVDRLGA